MAGASLQPIVVVVQRLSIRRTGEAAGAQLPPPVQLAFKHSGRGPDATQVSEILQVLGHGSSTRVQPLWMLGLMCSFCEKLIL